MKEATVVDKVPYLLTKTTRNVKDKKVYKRRRQSCMMNYSTSTVIAICNVNTTRRLSKCASHPTRLVQRLRFSLFSSIEFSNNMPRQVYSLVEVFGSCGFTGSVLVSLLVSLLGIDEIARKGFEVAAVIPAGKC